MTLHPKVQLSKKQNKIAEKRHSYQKSESEPPRILTQKSILDFIKPTGLTTNPTEETPSTSAATQNDRRTFTHTQNAKKHLHICKMQLLSPSQQRRKDHQLCNQTKLPQHGKHLMQKLKLNILYKLQDMQQTVCRPDQKEII